MTEVAKGKYFYGSVKVGERGQIVIPIEATLNYAAKRPLTDEEIDHLITMGDRMKKKVFGATKVIEALGESILISEEGRTGINNIDDGVWLIEGIAKW